MPRINRALTFFAKIFTLLFFVCFSFASSVPVQAALPGEGLRISPPIFDTLEVKPGNIYPQTIRIDNPTSDAVTFYPVAMNFKAKDELGNPDFIPANQTSEAYSLAHWLRFTTGKNTLAPNQEMKFNFEIVVPADAAPGGHYGVIFFTNEPPPDPSKVDITHVNLTTMLGALMLVKVPGEVVEKAVIREFSTQKFFFAPPVHFNIKIANIGNIHIKPLGDVTIKNWRGRELTALDINSRGGNILPSSIRRFDQTWSPVKSVSWKLIGRFTADLQATYGTSASPLTGQVTFWIIPWWLIILVVATILFFIIRYLRKRRRTKRKQIKPTQPPARPSSDNRVILR